MDTYGYLIEGFEADVVDGLRRAVKSRYSHDSLAPVPPTTLTPRGELAALIRSVAGGVGERLIRLDRVVFHRMSLEVGGRALMPDALKGTTFVTGTVAPEITEVVIEVDGLGDVEATVAKRWFTTWWPSRESFVVRGFGPDNNLVAEVTES